MHAQQEGALMGRRNALVAGSSLVGLQMGLQLPHLQLPAGEALAEALPLVPKGTPFGQVSSITPSAVIKGCWQLSGYHKGDKQSDRTYVPPLSPLAHLPRTYATQLPRGDWHLYTPSGAAGAVNSGTGAVRALGIGVAPRVSGRASALLGVVEPGQATHRPLLAAAPLPSWRLALEGPLSAH
jgi:hypothetical protein